MSSTRLHHTDCHRDRYLNHYLQLGEKKKKKKKKKHRPSSEKTPDEPKKKEPTEHAAKADKKAEKKEDKKPEEKPVCKKVETEKSKSQSCIYHAHYRHGRLLTLTVTLRRTEKEEGLYLLRLRAHGSV